MDLNSYQISTRQTVIYTAGIEYTALGLASEAGEVAGKVKKVIRDYDGILNDAHRAQIADELGDVLWYVARLADDMGIKLADIAAGNIDKLSNRAERGVLGGSGDKR
jgi:NTP pyrophosphatase (non-canonical NTP hydrolase)